MVVIVVSVLLSTTNCCSRTWIERGYGSRDPTYEVGDHYLTNSTTWLVLSITQRVTESRDSGLTIVLCVESSVLTRFMFVFFKRAR